MLTAPCRAALVAWNPLTLVNLNPLRLSYGRFRTNCPSHNFCPPLFVFAVIAAAKHEVSETLVSALQAAIAELEGTDAVFGKEYLTTAQKVLTKGGAAYVAKELKRLDSIISGKSVVPEKKSAFQLRRNLLAAFHAI
jgi:hypothetical protein